MYLTFAEQVRVVLRQRDMTIEQLADKLRVSRQNLNQKLNRNNFDEQTMRSVAEAMECDFFVSLSGINVVQQTYSGTMQPTPEVKNQPVKRRPSRINKHKEQQREFRERLLNEDPDLPEDTIKIINETSLIKGEKFEDYRSRIGHIAWEQYPGNLEEDQSDESEYEGMTAEEVVLHDYLRATNRTEEQKTIARQFPPMEGEDLYYYTKRILELENSMKNDNN